jgi:hypothetical protein
MTLTGIEIRESCRYKAICLTLTADNIFDRRFAFGIFNASGIVVTADYQ